jgi:hypothetical protein
MLVEEKANTQVSIVVFEAHNHMDSKAVELVLIMISSRAEYLILDSLHGIADTYGGYTAEYHNALGFFVLSK